VSPSRTYIPLVQELHLATHYDIPGSWSIIDGSIIKIIELMKRKMISVIDKEKLVTDNSEQ
jgi:hypothetical protein